MIGGGTEVRSESTLPVGVRLEESRSPWWPRTGFGWEDSHLQAYLEDGVEDPSALPWLCPGQGTHPYLPGATPSQASAATLAWPVLLPAVSSSHPLLPSQPHSAAPTHVQCAPARPAPSSKGPHPWASPDARAGGGSSLLLSAPHPIPARTPEHVCQ